MNENENEMTFPDYVTLEEKYKCDKCRFNERNVEYHYWFPQRLKYIFSDCTGKPSRRTQCKKRCWIFSTLFSILTALIIVRVFVGAFLYFQNLRLSIAYVVIFVVGMDIICCIIEYVVDKIFRKFEDFRRKRYDKKVADIEAINKEKQKEAERQKEKEKEVYKDIDNAKILVSNLSKTYLKKIENISDESKESGETKKRFLKAYKKLLSNLELLLEHVTLDNFYFSDIKRLFQIHLPKLEEYLIVYIDKVERGKETKTETEELIQLLEGFSKKVTYIKEHLNNSEAESFIYKMQALKEVVLYIDNKEK